MNIGIDVSVLEKGITGIGRYVLGILKYLPLIDIKNKYFLFSYKKFFPEQGFYKSITTGQYLPSKLYAPFWLNLILPRYLMKYKIELLFAPNNLAPVKIYKKGSWKNVVTVHDISHRAHYSFKSWVYRNYLDFFLLNVLPGCERIITVSEFSRRELINNYGIPPQKISVIYEFASEIFKPREISAEMRKHLAKILSIPEEFILYVGVIENRKNILGILRIGDIIHSRGCDIKILLVGRPGFGFRQIIREIYSRENVIYRTHVNDEYLPYLYNMAKIFLFPSLYEGFGLPPLEAMQSGIPVIASDAASLPEVIGYGGIMHKPYDYEGFANDIIRLLKDNNFYTLMSKRAIARAKEFNPQEIVKSLVGLFNDLT
ncbi:MAG: glycosyltransferase family 4 protein [candidate division WOR-3 bacterium]|nr:glycosyltransferase family 4 protein [candidate division WOR-3 bacterium]